MKNGIHIFLLLAAMLVSVQNVRADKWQDTLQSTIRMYDTNALVTAQNGSYGYRYHTQTFKIHTIHKTGALSETAHDEEGPRVDGLLLDVTLQDGPYQGAAEIPQDLKRPYWTTFINAYPVSTGKYLWMSLSYGSRADTNLIAAIKCCFGPIVLPTPGTINPTIKKTQPPAP